ncbi:hypothetical protein ABZX75_17235 [Streptomyces sp. NPDC003038]|uniref:hypothetical protein n=1 Tax=unclassified Streptomyces TaxID=2593676 RepID=UPI0033A752B3
MSWVEVFFAYIVTVDAVVATADVWGPLLTGAACLGIAARLAPGRGRHRRTRRPDTSGDDADNAPALTTLTPSPRL